MHAPQPSQTQLVLGSVSLVLFLSLWGMLNTSQHFHTRSHFSHHAVVFSSASHDIFSFIPRYAFATCKEKILKKQHRRKIQSQKASNTVTPPPTIDEPVIVTEEYIQSLMAVFGHDSLAQRTAQTEKLFPKPKHQFGRQTIKKIAKLSTQEKKDFISSTLASVSQILPFKNNMGLGSDSSQDIHVVMSANQNWLLDPKLKLDTEQVYKYGVESGNQFNTNFKLTHVQSKESSIFSQLQISRSTGDENFYWTDKTYQQFQLQKNQSIILGIYSSGHYDREWILNSWGPYISWKQPIWRNWLFLQSDLSYYNDKGSDLEHRISSSFGFEVHF
ncbi:hypothetical protein QR665_16560 [Acinetobacter gerneri]|uniref:hypothetical protein n=1 Tax=Acinetobacter gerneri TaxID=202952 RepID=UPI002935C507|nr:hypothetical protein [Acinetobacter gerneri]MDV2441066.1 hypothetical protein [Acinetobacter gerneri]